MHSVIWTFQFPENVTKVAIRETIAKTAHTFLNVPGLVRKCYVIAEDGRTMCGIYLWNSRAEADAFYTPAWIKLVTDRWNVSPTRSDWETPMVVETEAGYLRDAASKARAAE